jgi:hypothetical protein
MPIVEMSWRRTLHRTPRSSTKLHSAEVLTSTSTGAHIKPLDPVLDLALDKPIDPELCSLHAASSLIEPQLRPLPAGFVLDCSTWTHRHLHGRRTRLAIDRCCSARRPDHRDQQVGQACSSATPLLSDGDIMGFNSPGQSTLKPPQSAAASASSISRAGGTAGWLWNLRSEWTTGRSAYLAVPEASSPSTIGKTGPYPTNVHLGTGGPSPVKRANFPRSELPQGIPGADRAPLGPTSQDKGYLYPPTRTGQPRTTWLSV